PNEVVFEMIGAELPLAFFKRIGIKLEGTWDARKWVTLAFVFLFVYSLYALKKFPERPYSWPFYLFLDEGTFKGVVARIFEVAFVLVPNVIAVQAMAIDNAWRAWGIYQPWPLFFGTFDFKWWNTSDPRAVMWFFVGTGLVGTFGAIPLLARWHGKRFCTWI